MTSRTKTSSLLAKTLLFNAMIQCALAFDPDTDAVFKTLKGIRYQLTMETPGLKYLSMAGGAPVTIQGSNLGPMPNMNDVIFASANLVGVEITGPALHEDDIFRSFPAAGQIAYTMPSVMELFKTDYDTFNGDGMPNGQNPPIAFEIHTHNVAQNWFVACEVSSNCYVQYHRDYTPLLHAITPSNVYKDQQIQFHVNIKNVHSTTGTPAAAWPFREVRLGKSFMRWTDHELGGPVMQTDRLTAFQVDQFEAFVGDQKPALNSEPGLLFHTGLAYNLPTSQTCNFAGDDCWKVRTHAKIESLSAGQGYKNGGQTLTINGWGFDTEKAYIDVQVDGVECQVIDNQKDSITCITGAALADSDTTLPKLGQPGLLREKLKHPNPEQGTYWGAFTNPDYPVVQTNLSTSFEVYVESQETNYLQRLSGWFTAPATADYRFYISCDDACKLLLDSTNPQSSGNPPLQKDIIAFRNYWIGWRKYFHANDENNQHQSELISLVEGESYYIEGLHLANGGENHFTVSMEITLPGGNPEMHPLSNSLYHPHSKPQIVQLSVDQINTPEQWSLLVTNVDDGSYKLNFLNPTTTPASLATYGPVSVKAAAWQFKAAIVPYYRQYWGCEVDVILVMYDENQVITTVAANAKSYQYTVTVPKQIIGYSINSISVTKIQTISNIVPTPPIKGVKSSVPISGNFAISCFDPSGKEWTTPDMKYNTETKWIQNQISLSIPFLADKIEVEPDYRYRYAENGVSFMIKYSGIKGPVQACKIISGKDAAILGNEPTFQSKILVEADKSLIFEPIPLEFLRTYTTQPQVLVTIDSKPALCGDLACDYFYFTDGAVVSSQAVTGSQLQVTGTEIQEIISVVYGTVKCDVDSSTTNSNIACNLDDIPVAGDQTVQITTVHGLIPTDASFVPTQEALIITSVIPNMDINYLGGTRIVIQGSGFGNEAAALWVSFADGTACEILKIESTVIVCETDRFSPEAQPTLAISIEINGMVDNTHTIALLSQAQTTETVTPNRVSPVLKKVLTIQLSSNYTGNYDMNEFSVFLINDIFPKALKPLYLMSVDDQAKTLSVKFPGADSGNYKLRVVSEAHGRIDTDGLKITVVGRVLDFSPKTGSIYGGTVITITGENFSDDPLDNPVKIGEHYCFVLTTNTTQITCKTDLLPNEGFGSEQLIVFFKTSEEAVCDVPDGCLFSYVSPSASLEDIQNGYDSVTKSHIATVIGSGFDNSIRLILDGTEQRQISVIDHPQEDGSIQSHATFEILELDDAKVTYVEVLTAEGYPANSGTMLTYQVTPKFHEISPLFGNAGGSQIIVTGSGFGRESKDLNLFDSNTSKLVCSKVTVLKYGKFMCLTNPGINIDGSGIKLAYGTLHIEPEDVALTSYSQQEFVVLQDATLAGNSITITLTGVSLAEMFQYSGQIPTVSFAGIDADTANVVIDPTTGVIQLVADWLSTGVAAATASPIVRVISPNDVNILHNAYNPNNITISKLLVVIPLTTSNAECSFAGGCSYMIAADGLYSALKNTKNLIDVCGSQCVVDDTQSSQTMTVCKLPSIATSSSIANFQIKEDGVLSGTVFPATATLLTDGILTTDYVDTRTSGCNFGMTFPKNQVAVLDEAKIFINFVTTVTPYANNIGFYGSNDNWATSQFIAQLGQNVKEGWNYFKNWEDGADKPAFNSYMFKGKVTGSCRVTEFRLTGVQSFADTTDDFTCTPTALVDGLETTLTPVTYKSEKTALLNKIWPRYGSVLGGDTVTLTGENFSATATTTVKFDNRTCQVTSQTTTEIVCTTSDKPYRPDTPKIEIFIEGQGNVATQGLFFRYVSLWSEPQTWGNDIPPQHGESISIPKGQHLLIDVDKTPEVFAVVVEGSLIFAPDALDSHHREFDAHYIMVNGGYMEAGTEEFPYTSHLTITMHGDASSPFLPIYGNKVIGVRFGQLELHGVTRDVTWTRLNQTVAAGDSLLILDDYVDWNVGEEIVIAGSVFGNQQSETRFITAVNGNTITLDQPLEFEHMGEAPTFGEFEIPMKAEVGLLTRNVLFRGDEETSFQNQFGAHIIVHSPGDESSVARICYVEIKNGGQAFKLGRYPIHFHMIGTVHQSHVIGNAIHRSFNRAITTHGVHYFHVQHNVAYDTKGHTFFIEDAAETNNYYDHNLAIKIGASFSLLNTDVTPGGFWITHPNNIFTNNAIANGDAYGYWFDMQEHSLGPSFDINICGFNSKLGQFKGNSAHSLKKYGLRIFHGLRPRTYPCKPLVFDGDFELKGKTDPYWQNPVIPAIFEDSVFWRCNTNGAIMEESGAVVFKNLKCADNGLVGMEFSMIKGVGDGQAKIQGGVVVGDTGLTPSISQYLRQMQITGIVVARTENFTVEGVSFYNFDWGKSSALKDCSHCWHPASTDSGARTTTTSGLFFDAATVPKRIQYEVPYRGIWFDKDGSLTGLGPNTWATKDFIHNRQPECTQSEDVHNGLICDNTIAVRRIVFHGHTPKALDAMLLKIAQWEDHHKAAVTADEATLFEFLQDKDHTHFSKVEYRQKQDPIASWAVPFVTGHKYRIHWGWANDFVTMTATPSNRWLPDDKNIHFMTNFTDVRVAIEVNAKNIATGQLVPVANRTYIEKLESEFLSGDNVIYNQTEVREFNFAINGKAPVERNSINLKGIRCYPGQCIAPVVVVPISENQTFWSDPTVWPSGKVPVANQTVTIEAGVNMILDIDTPILDTLIIKGRLTFQNNGTAQNLTINARIVFIPGGELIIGNETNPFNGTATVRLFGISTDPALAFDSAIHGGNKMIANLGLVSFWGQSRNRSSRLRQTIYKNQTAALVSPGLDWVAGDRIYLAPTATQYTHSDYMEIAIYNKETGEVTFTENSKYYHWGAYESTAQAYNGVDMRGEVILLSRNVRVIGEDTQSWGGQIVTSDTMEDTGTIISGQLFFNNVEVYNCSQENTYQSAIRFDGARTKHHLVQNTVVHEGHAWSFSAIDSANVLIKDSDFIGAKVIGFMIQTSKNITIDGVVQAGVEKRKLELGKGNKFVDKEGCFSICAYIPEQTAAATCSAISIINSVAAGCPYAGFVVPGHSCGMSKTQQVFRNNIAHSSEGSGAVIFPDGSNEQLECFEGSHFAAYKNQQAGIANHMVNRRMNMTQITLIDNTKGISLQQGNPDDASNVAHIKMNHVTIFGEPEAQDCPDINDKSSCLCEDKFGFMLSGTNHGKKDPHINSPSGLPMHKIKSYGSYYATTEYDQMTFSNWKSNKTNCGAFQSIFGVNEHASDYIPLQKFTNSKFIDVSEDAMAWIYDPPEKWNHPDDCIGFPCTAPSNVVITHEGVTYEGVSFAFNKAKSFQIVSDNAPASSKLDNCKKMEEWNAWHCENSYLGVLVFNSLDADWQDRNMAPVYVYNDETGFNNTLNHQMDHVWDGFYTGQKHKSQFASLIQTTGNYTMKPTGTTPGRMRYTLRADRGAIKVKVPYSTAGSYQVKVEGKAIPYTTWDSAAGAPSELSGRKGCGENRYIGVKNILEFWITAGCTVDVHPVDAILANVRMQWTLAEFYASGGVVSFTDRVSAALGIKAYQVKTVAVYQGSVIVDYFISAANEEVTSGNVKEKEALAKIATKLNTIVSSPEAMKTFGAPILNATTGQTTIVGGQAKSTTTPKAGATVLPVPAPIIQDTTTVSAVTKVTTQTAATSTTESPKSNQTQVIVIVIIVLVLLVAAAIGAGVFIKNRLRKTTSDAITASQAKSENNSGAIVDQHSEIALEPQFNAEDVNFDIDIFTNAKRKTRKINDDEVTEKYYADDVSGKEFNSGVKLTSAVTKSKIELTAVKTKPL